MKKIFTFLFIGLFFLNLSITTPTQLFANEDSDAKVSVLPKDGLRFVLKRIGEKIKLSFYIPFPEKKCKYYQSLLDSRLYEVLSVSEDKDIANIETTSSRYSSTAGQMTEYAISKKLDNCKKEAKQLMEKHILLLEPGRDSFDATTAEWRFVQNDINSLKIYIENLNQK